MDKLAVGNIPPPSELEIRCTQAGLDTEQYLVHAGDQVRVALREHGDVCYGTVMYIERKHGVTRYAVLVESSVTPSGVDGPSRDTVLYVPINGWPRVSRQPTFWDKVVKLA